MNDANLTRWLNGNTVTDGADKLPFWDSSIQYGFAIIAIVGIWLATEVKQNL